jgi:hypothetical protein
VSTPRHTRQAGAARPHLQRAPRLRPDQYIAGSITRVGRFVDIDPLKGRSLPTLMQVTAVAAWAALTIESFRRAGAGSRGDD